MEITGTVGFFSVLIPQWLCLSRQLQEWPAAKATAFFTHTAVGRKATVTSKIEGFKNVQQTNQSTSDSHSS